MDMWALAITGISIVLYFLSKKKPIFVLTTGIGLGLLWGAIWATMLIGRAFGGL